MKWFYIWILGIPILSSIVVSRMPLKYRKKIHWATIIICAFLLSARINVGADLVNYKNYYEAYLNGNGPAIAFSDFGYNLINQIFASLGFPFSGFLFVVAVFNLRAYYAYLEVLDAKNEYIPTIIYFLVFDIFVYSLSAIRQSISIAFLLYSIIFQRQKRHIPMVTFLALGCTIHWSMLAVLPFLLVGWKYKSTKLRGIFLFLLVSTLAYIIVVRTNLLNRIAGINYNLTLYLIYENNMAITGRYQWVVYLFVSIAWVFVISFFSGLETGRLRIKTSKQLFAEITLDYEDWLVFLFLVSKTWQNISYNTALPRFQMYLYFFLPFAAEKLIAKMDKKGRILTNAILTIILLYSFVNDLNTYSFFYGNASFLF